MVEDEERDVQLIEHTLRGAGFAFELRRVQTETDYRRELAQFRPAVILSDHGLPQFDGFSALKLAQHEAADTPFIFVTGSLGEEMTIKALKSGATDFVLKHHLQALGPALHRALRQREAQKERRLAQQALLSSEERYRSLVELSPDALFVLIDEQIAFMNSAAVRLLGAANPEQLLGRPLLDFIHPESLQPVQSHLQQLPHRNRPLPFSEEKLQRLDGSTIEAEMAAAPLTFAGHPAAQVIVHDLSERRQASAEIRRLNVNLERRVQERTAELELANKELEAFSYSVSHDLRAPLRHIDGFVEILLATQAASLDDAGRQYLGAISDSAKRMGLLIDDLLAFSRTARAELNKSPVRLNELTQSVLRDLERDTQGRAIDWQIDSLPEVQADPILLRQVLANLIGNALKYTRPRQPARIQILNQSTAQEAVVCVRDNGVGFDMRYATKLFGVFQRLHRSSDFEGTGIGLANVRRIIHRHGGRTWAEGEIDKGAAFFFSLPLSPSAPTSPLSGSEV